MIRKRSVLWTVGLWGSWARCVWSALKAVSTATERHCRICRVPPPCPSTLKSGGARAPPRYMAPAPLPAATFSFQ